MQIKSHWKQKELAAKSWDHYVTKTSNYEILKVFSSFLLHPQIHQTDLLQKIWRILTTVTLILYYFFMQEVKAQREKYIESSRNKLMHKDATLHPAEVFSFFYFYRLVVIFYNILNLGCFGFWTIDSDLIRLFVDVTLDAQNCWIISYFLSCRLND